MLNDLLLGLGLEGLKPALTALVLPPLPWLLLMLAGGAVLRRRAAAGWVCLAVGAAGLWMSSTLTVGEALEHELLRPFHALSRTEIDDLAHADRTAIVVLGAGRESFAPEYGRPSLSRFAVERLRYGLWLSRATGLPAAFSGGTGHAQPDGPSEAEIAAGIAEQDFGRPLEWTEGRSRDTHENAVYMVPLLRAAGVKRIVLVTHGWHMRRSLREFERAITHSGGGMTLTPAPMGLTLSELRPLLRWLPSDAGIVLTRRCLHEWLGLLASR